MGAAFFDKKLFNDGEGIEYADFNALQSMLRAGVYDGLFGSMLPAAHPTPWQGTSPTTTLCFVPRWYHGIPYAGASARQVKCKGGTVLQPISGTIDGATQRLLAYRLDDDEIDVTLAANASGNPRIDLISIQLTNDVAANSVTRDFEDSVTFQATSTSFNKSGRTTLTITVTQGTPGASPAKPAVPANNVAWCYVLVPNGHATAFSEGTHFIDVRMPMGIRVLDIPSWQIPSVDTSGMTRASGDGWKSAGAGGTVIAHLPHNPLARVLGVIVSSVNSVGTLALHRYTYSSDPVTTTNISATPPVLSCDFSLPFGAGSFGRIFAYADGLWASGGRCASTFGTNMTIHNEGLRVLYTSTGVDVVHGVRWLLAGGF